MRYVDGIPDLAECGVFLSVKVLGTAAFIRCARFLARISLASGKIEWLVERSLSQMSQSTYDLPRRITLSRSVFWIDAGERAVAELSLTECGGLIVSGRNSITGEQLWEHFVPVPDPAEWAESVPAWPGAQTEDIEAFIADDANRLVVCLFRQSRRSRRYSSAIDVATIPPYECQLDAVRLEASTGSPIWRSEYPNLRVGILERRAFNGIWSTTPRLGVIDFETGINTVLRESPHALGWPVRDSDGFAVPWHSTREVGVEWLDERGCQTHSCKWPQPRVNNTLLRVTDAGLALQTNEQTLSWLGKGAMRVWSARIKPYIYRVHSARDSDVFVGSDGNGGRLLALDPCSGAETLNLKPVIGGVGDLAMLSSHQALVSTFRVSKSNSVPSRMLVLSMKDRRYSLNHECVSMLATWEHGVVCRTGQNGERLAFLDVRDDDF